MRVLRKPALASLRATSFVGTVFVAFALHVFIGTTYAGSKEASEPAIHFTAPPVCPSAAEFRASLRARTSGGRSKDAPKIRSFDVKIQANEGGFSGLLRIRDEDDATSERSVVGSTCSEVVDAMAFLCAVAMGFVVEPAPATSPSASSSASASTSPISSTSASSIPPAVSASSNVASVRASIGAHVLVTSGIVAPSIRPGILAFGDVELRARPGSSLRAGVLWTTSGTIAPTIGEGSAKVSLLAGMLEVCPIGIEVGVTVRPCLGIHAGAMRGEGADVSNARSETRPWFALVPAVRATWQPVSWAFLELGAGASLALTRHRFLFTPSALVYETPAIAWLLGFGFGIRFP